MDSLRERVTAHLSETLRSLDRLIRRPSVAAQGLGIDEAASVVRSMLAEAGAARADIVRVPGAAPAVLADFDGRTDRTLLFYNHYDVQPPEPLEEWTAPPFELTARDGRLYGRGTGDNKGDLVTRIAAIRLLRDVNGGLPCRVRFLVEGEEEVGSPHIGAYVEAFRDRLAADACIWEYGDRDPDGRVHVIAGVKGICYVELELTATNQDLHSMWGAIIDGAGSRMAWLLAGLRSAGGRIKIPGFYDAVLPPTPAAAAAADVVPVDERFVRSYTGTSDGPGTTGVMRRLLFDPTCTVCGIGTGYTGGGMKTVLPQRARAKVDFRLVPDQDPEEIVHRLRAHLDANGFSDCAITPMSRERAFQTDPAAPFVRVVIDAARAATGREVVLLPTSPGTGPMHAVGRPLGMPIVSIGAGYWGGNIHAPDEHVRADDFVETIEMIARLLERFAVA
jgi:acetylornithine deacetylase/succinyl-diaminopimelate desuccinylase-like protein